MYIRGISERVFHQDIHYREGSRINNAEPISFGRNSTSSVPASVPVLLSNLLVARRIDFLNEISGSFENNELRNGEMF